MYYLILCFVRLYLVFRMTTYSFMLPYGRGSTWKTLFALLHSLTHYYPREELIWLMSLGEAIGNFWSSTFFLFPLLNPFIYRIYLSFCSLPCNQYSWVRESWCYSTIPMTRCISWFWISLKKKKKDCQHFFLYMLAFSLIKKWNLFIHLLNPGWPSDFFMPVECSGNHALCVLGLALERPGSFHLPSIGIWLPCCVEVQPALAEREKMWKGSATWSNRSHVEGDQSTIADS